MDAEEITMTPLSWANHFGIKGLVEEQWQEYAYTFRGGEFSYEPDPHWDTVMTRGAFLGLLYGEWAAPRPGDPTSCHPHRPSARLPEGQAHLQAPAVEPDDGAGARRARVGRSVAADRRHHLGHR